MLRRSGRRRQHVAAARAELPASVASRPHDGHAYIESLLVRAAHSSLRCAPTQVHRLTDPRGLLSHPQPPLAGRGRRAGSRDVRPFPLGSPAIGPKKHDDRLAGRSHQWLPAGLRWPQWYARRITASRIELGSCQESRVLLSCPLSPESHRYRVTRVSRRQTSGNGSQTIPAGDHGAPLSRSSGTADGPTLAKAQPLGEARAFGRSSGTRASCASPSRAAPSQGTGATQRQAGAFGGLPCVCHPCPARRQPWQQIRAL